MKLKKYNIAITKPWSKEMYAHNDEVLREVVEEVKATKAEKKAEKEEAAKEEKEEKN